MSDLSQQAAKLWPWLRPRLVLPLPMTAFGGLMSPYPNTTPNGTDILGGPIGWDMTPRALYVGVSIATTNNASNYWTIALRIITPGLTATTQGNVTTAALSANAWNVLTLDTFITSPWPAATYAVAYLSIAKTGTPGSLTVLPSLMVS